MRRICDRRRAEGENHPGLGTMSSPPLLQDHQIPMTSLYPHPSPQSGCTLLSQRNFDLWRLQSDTTIPLQKMMPAASAIFYCAEGMGFMGRLRLVAPMVMCRAVPPLLLLQVPRIGARSRSDQAPTTNTPIMAISKPVMYSLRIFDSGGCVLQRVSSADDANAKATPHPRRVLGSIPARRGRRQD
ncbi:hypothetical protein B0H17DRAFT_1128435 [Mycena rosella]|uniref:Uncharacterized protein n=1 Tax=Mycena rosella TaxID=1033263 RepID=A0AAD7GPG9_MYCRO|nr:hypothetical protein B0H17DRAFT_1128435 [Mycena rosella]